VIRPHGASTSQSDAQTVWVTKATIPTRHGNFETHVFRSARRLAPADLADLTEGGRPEPAGAHQGDGDDGLSLEHVALVFGDVASLEDRSDVLIRVHSECMTSEVFGSLKCDCKEQLEVSMAAIARAGSGAVLYLRQEGRGIGLANKIRAYALQSHGHDTVDANRLLGLPDDARSYEVARDMLTHFGVAGVRLLTNNPAKVTALRNLGVHVVGRIPIVVPANPHSSPYLEAKRLRMDHDLPTDVSVVSTVPRRAAAGGDAE
jgi:GTP cyclohydrolase II